MQKLSLGIISSISAMGIMPFKDVNSLKISPIAASYQSWQYCRLERDAR